jgi:DNA-binding transcriptional LysR family regulator
MTPSRLRQLEAFRAVMQSGSVSRAAQRMYLSQPAVTKLLRGLEDETGLPLFDRSRRHLQPTPEAVKLEGAVADLFAAADRLDRTIDDMRGIGSGELRVAAMPLMGLSLIPRLLARFAQEVQPVRISLVVTSSREVHDLVQAGNADLGFALPVGRSALVAAPPIELPGLVVLPPRHRLARNKTVPLSELDDEPYISLGRQYRLRDQVDELFTINGITPRLVAETQNAAAACAMVAAGLGFTIAEAVTVKGLNAQVVARSLRPTVTYSVTILGSPGHPLSTAALAFLKLVRSDLNS